MDMEYELRALRNQLAEKSKHFLQLQKKVSWICIRYTCLFFLVHSSSFSLSSLLCRHFFYTKLHFSIMQLALCRKSDDNISLIYEIDGTEALGSCLRVRSCSNDAPDLSKCTIQWYRSSSDGSKKELISGPLTFPNFSFSHWIVLVFYSYSSSILRARWLQFRLLLTSNDIGIKNNTQLM